MKMERLDENTIRVLLGDEDLQERGITGLDLLSNQKKIERFFYSILEEVDQEHTFDKDDAVTFQVLPTQDGLELLISRNLNNLPLNETYSDDDDIEEGSDLPSEGVTEFVKQQLLKHDRLEKSDQRKSALISDEPMESSKQVIIKLADFDDWITLANKLRLASGYANLYYYQTNYYAELGFNFDNSTQADIRANIALAYEYSQPTTLTAGVLAEHAQIIMRETALETTRLYF